MSHSCSGTATSMSGGGNGMCKKKPMRLSDLARAKLRGEGDQMIVVNPDEIVEV